MNVSAAQLSMYPFPFLRPGYESFYRSVQRHCEWLEPTLGPWGDEHAAPQHRGLFQTCGWPLVTKLRDQVRVVGAFQLRLADELRCPKHPHWYRSVLVANASPGPAAVNSFDSLSGWISLRAVRNVAEALMTGSHYRSVEAVRLGEAAVASIDAVTWTHMKSSEPSHVGDLEVVGHGPWVPSLPLVVAADTPPDRLCRLREILASEAPHAPAELLIDGFVPLTLKDYDDALAGLRATA